jgi:hypothetical protein
MRCSGVSAEPPGTYLRRTLGSWSPPPVANLLVAVILVKVTRLPGSEATSPACKCRLEGCIYYHIKLTPFIVELLLGNIVVVVALYAL